MTLRPASRSQAHVSIEGLRSKIGGIVSGTDGRWRQLVCDPRNFRKYRDKPRLWRIIDAHGPNKPQTDFNADATLNWPKDVARTAELLGAIVRVHGAHIEGVIEAVHAAVAIVDPCTDERRVWDEALEVRLDGELDQEYAGQLLTDSSGDYAIGLLVAKRQGLFYAAPLAPFLEATGWTWTPQGSLDGKLLDPGGDSVFWRKVREDEIAVAA